MLKHLVKATNMNMKLLKQFNLTDDNGKTIKYYQYTTGNLVDGTLRSIIVRGEIKITNKKGLICGVGINDADYITEKKIVIICEDGRKFRKLLWRCPFHQTWKGMINRCYSDKTQVKQSTYVGCTVSEEWVTFSNFKTWMERQDWEDKQLDKDLLFEGNKVYSAETCVFVSHSVNSFTIDSGAARGVWMIGASWDKNRSLFISQCSNPFTKKNENLGYFDSEQEAHNAWLNRKLELAYELAAIQTDERVTEALIHRYLNYKN